MNNKQAVGFWLKVSNERSVSVDVLIEPWGTGCKLTSNATAYLFFPLAQYQPEVVYQDDFIVAHGSVGLFDAHGTELFNFSGTTLIPPDKNK